MIVAQIIGKGKLKRRAFNTYILYVMRRFHRINFGTQLYQTLRASLSLLKIPGLDAYVLTMLNIGNSLYLRQLTLLTWGSL